MRTTRVDVPEPQRFCILGAITLAAVSLATLAQADPTNGFIRTDGGPHDYALASNWFGSAVNGVWDSSLILATNQTVSFSNNTTLATGLSFGYDGAFDLLLRAASATARTITLGGDVTVDSVADGRTVTIGHSAYNLNVALGADRILSVAGADTLSIINVVSGAGFGMTKEGPGTLTLSGINTFTGKVILKAGTLRATTSTAALGAGTVPDTVTLAGGTLQLANDTGLGFSRNTTVSGNAEINSDRLTAMLPGSGVTHTLGTLAIGGQELTVSGGANVNGGVAGLTFGAPTLSGNPTFTINNPSAGGVTVLTVPSLTNDANTVTFKGNGYFVQTGVWGNGSGGLTLDPAFTGVVNLNQANTFTGPVTVRGGTLRVSSQNQAMGTGTATLELAGGTLQSLTSTLTPGRNTVISGDATILLLNNSGTFTLGTLAIGGQTVNVNSTAYAGGAGTEVLVFGATSLSGGPIFRITTPSEFQSGFIFPGRMTQLSLGAITDNGNTITLKGNGNFVQTGAWGGGSGGLLLDSDYVGTATLNQANTFTGPILVTAGKLVASGNAAALGSAAGATTVSTGGALDLQIATVNEPLNLAGTGIYQQGSLLNSSGTAAGSSGTVTLDADSSVGVWGAGNLTLSGPIGESVAGRGLTKVGTGSGVLTFSSASGNSYTGPTTLGAGTLALSYGASVGMLSDSAALNLDGGTVSLAGAATGTNDETVASTELRAGANTVTGVSGANAKRLQMNTIMRSSGATLNVSVAGGATSDNANDPSGILGAWATVGNDWAVGGADDTPIVALPAGSYSNVAETSWDPSFNVSRDASDSLTASRDVNTLRLAQSAARTLDIGSGQTLRIRGGGLLVSGNYNAIIQNGTLTAGAGVDVAGELAVHETGAAANGVNIGSMVADNGLGQLVLTKSGSGYLTLSGPNTYTGPTYMNAGTLNINNATALGSSGVLTINAGTINSSAADITVTANNPQNWNGDFTFTGSYNLNMGSGVVTLGGHRTVTTTAKALTVGKITGPYNLTKAGAGTLVIGANGVASDYTGHTTISAGTLRIGSADVLPDGASAGNIIVTGTLDLNGNSDTINGLHGAGTITSGVTGSPVLSVGNNDASSWFGGTFVTGSGTPGLTKVGNGTLTLSGANTFTGPLNLNAGKLRATSAAGSLGGAGMLVLKDGTELQLANDAALTTTRNTVVVTGNVVIVSDRLTPGAGFAHIMGSASPSFAVGTGGPYTITIKAGDNVTSGTAGITLGTTTLNSSPTLVITNSPAGGVAQVSLGAVTNFGNTVTLKGNGNFVQTGIMSGAGGLTLDAGYTGVATLSQANTFTGGLTVNGGQLTISAAGNRGSTGATALNGGILNLTHAGALTGNGALNITGGALAGSVTLSSITPQNWNGDFAFINTSALNMGTGTVTMVADRKVTVAGADATVGGPLMAAGQTLTKLGRGKLILSGKIDGVGNGFVVEDGTLQLGATNTYTGVTMVNPGGTLKLAHVGALGGSGALTLNGGTVAIPGGSGTILMTGTSPQNWNGDFVFVSDTGGDGAIMNGSATLANHHRVTVLGTTLLRIGGTVNGGGFDVTKEGTGVLELNNTVQTGAGGITANAGKLALVATNTYTGATTLNPGGWLDLRNNGALAGNGNLVINGGTLGNNSGSGGRTLVSVNQQTWNGDFTFNTSGSDPLTFGTGIVTLGGHLTVNAVSGTLTIGGTVVGSGYNLVKSGAGTLVFTNSIDTDTGSVTVNGGTLQTSGNDTFSGGVTINSGTLTTSGNGTASGGVVLNAGGTLTLDRSSTPVVTNSAPISGPLGSGALTVNGGIVSAAGTSVRTVSNPVLLNGSFTSIGGDDASGYPLANLSGQATLNDNIAVTVGNAAGGYRHLWLSGDITDGGNSFGISVNSGNANNSWLVMSGSNSFDGGVIAGASGASRPHLTVGTASSLGTGPLTVGTYGVWLRTLVSGLTVPNTVYLNGNLNMGGYLVSKIGEGKAFNLSGDIIMSGNRTLTCHGYSVYGLDGSLLDDGAGSYKLVYAIQEIGTGGPLALTGSNRTHTPEIVVGGSAGNYYPSLTVSGGTNMFSGLITVQLGSFNVTGTNNTFASGFNVLGGTVNMNSSAVSAGPVTVWPGGRFVAAAPGNFAAGQNVRFAGNAAGMGVLSLAYNAAPPADIESISSGVLAIGVAGYSQSLDMGAIGNGEVFLGSTGASGSYVASSLGIGGDNTYRIGGGGGTLTFDVPASTVGVLTDTGHPGAKVIVNRDFVLNGGGTVVLKDANDYSGLTTIKNGTLTLMDDGALTGTSGIELYGNNATATVLKLDNTGTANNNDRLPDAAPVTLRGSTLQYLGRASTASAEAVGVVTADRGYCTIDVVAGGAGSAELTLAGLNRPVNGGTVHFTGLGNMGKAGNYPRVFVTGQPAGLIGAWAFVNLGNGTGDWADYQSTGVTNFSAYEVGGQANWTDFTKNAKVTGDETLTGDRQLNTLLLNPLGAARTIALGANSLNVNQGILMGRNDAGGASAIVTNTAGGYLTAGGASTGTNELLVTVNSRPLTIYPPIADNASGGKVALTKSGDGILWLNATNTLASVTLLSGQIAPRNDSALGAGPLILRGGTIGYNSNQGTNPQRTFTNDVVLDGYVGFNCVTFTNNTVTLVGNSTVALPGGSVADPANFYGNITGTGNLRVGAANVNVRFYGSNTYNGVTIVPPGGGTYNSTVLLGGSAGNSIPGDFIIDDGSASGNAYVTLAASNRIADTATVTVNSLGRLQLNGFDETIGALEGCGNVSCVLGGAAGNPKSILTINKTAGISTFDGQIINQNSGSPVTLSLVKDGSGTQVLGGQNTYTGVTTVANGTLLVNGSLASGSTVTVASGATLGGNGTINGAVSNLTGGILAAGASVGKLTINNTLAMQADSVISWELGAATNDVIQVNGDLVLDASTTLRLFDAGAAAAPSGDYVVIQYTGADPAALGTWTIDYGTTGWTGGQVILDAGNKQVLVRFSGEPGELRFSGAPYLGSESSLSATVTVGRINGSAGAVTVDYFTSNGTAMVDEDYVAATGTLTFSEGETSKTFTVSIIDDSIRESGETVLLRLRNATGGATLVSPSNAVLTIADNDRNLVVISAHGSALPAIGTNVFTSGSSQTCIMQDSPVENGTTQYVCTGWIGTGDAPGNGVTTNTGSFVLTADSSIEWTWVTNVQFNSSSGPNGSVAGDGNGWYALGGSVTVTGVPVLYYRFDLWSGDVPGGQAGVNPLTLTMDQPRSIAAGFTAIMATNSTPHWWLAQYGLATNDEGALYEDGDGMPAWKEYVAGTDPTNAASVLQLVGVDRPAGTGDFVLRWDSVTGRVYAVEFTTNLLTTGFSPLTSGLPATPTMNVWTDSVPPEASVRFYRIGVTNSP